ncbi:predicted protein [Nematostella vectensis]|uniref:Uncharacterized protein n=1 Tax=Nematostella vectensis TaxID=45351 RepID=A7T0T7_NEMVE|nr:predicted protein [Nematostella vectensis]|eukprot:XP_001622530.1 predicted protein [Nematostella vectensis]
MKEKTEKSGNAQLAELVNNLIFKDEKPDEAEMKESMEKIIRPENCNLLVATKVDELIWNRLRPQTRSFDSRAQTAQSALVKGVIELTKQLNGIIDLQAQVKENKIDNSDIVIELDKLVEKGMSSIEMLSYANYELNCRRRECMKPDLNDDYTSLFSSSVPINKFLFGGDTSNAWMILTRLTSGQRGKYKKHQKKAEQQPDKYPSLIIDGMDQSEDALREFMAHMNSIHRTIKFTFEWSTSQPVLESSSRCRGAIGRVPMVAYRKPRSLKYMLVHSSLKEDSTQELSTNFLSNQTMLRFWQNREIHFVGNFPLQQWRNQSVIDENQRLQRQQLKRLIFFNENNITDNKIHNYDFLEVSHFYFATKDEKLPYCNILQWLYKGEISGWHSLLKSCRYCKILRSRLYRAKTGRIGLLDCCYAMITRNLR